MSRQLNMANRIGICGIGCLGAFEWTDSTFSMILDRFEDIIVVVSIGPAPK